MTLYATQHEVLEWGYTIGKALADPFNEVEIDVILSHETGQAWRVPAYWAGGQEFRVRFAPPLPGCYQAVLASSVDIGQEMPAQEVQAAAYAGDHPLVIHGKVQVAPDRHHLQFSDGTPFFWLGDTWWMGLCKRLTWPEEFQQLTADRLAKGFSVIQIVAGLYPDMPGFDPRGANEAGFPWEAGYARLNPSYFDQADLRIRWLARQGLTPCIVGCWGYYLPLLGIEKMKQHWRNLVARWGAYPVVWCLAGEALMPYYLSEDKTGDEKLQHAGWTEIARYVRSIDPYQRFMTIHPTSVGRAQLQDDSLLDLNMLQTGHDGYRSLPNTINLVTTQYQRQPAMPVLVGEANYEGIIHGNEANLQRLTFWASILSGAAGHTYGANGIWQLNTRQQPYGASPWGGTWGGPAWEAASQLDGAAHLSLAKRLLERFEWQRFEPHPEWVQPAGSPEKVDYPFAAGIPGKVRVIYFYWPTFQSPNLQYQVVNLEPGASYRAYFWDPRTAQEYDLGLVNAETAPGGAWSIPIQPALKDWVVVLERVDE